MMSWAGINTIRGELAGHVLDIQKLFLALQVVSLDIEGGNVFFDLRKKEEAKFIPLRKFYFDLFSA